MTTVRQIERFWGANDFSGLVVHLCADRPEFGVLVGSRSAIAAAALSVVRVDEFGQSYQPIAGRLIRTLIAAQEPDGGWGDVATTAIALRALMCSSGEGLAIERGLRWLAEVQKTDGAWPEAPPRRLPADAVVTAFVVLQLGPDARFAAVCRSSDAVRWLNQRRDEMDASTRRLAERAALRCRMQPRVSAPLFATAA